MNRERGQVLILVLILLVVGSLMIVPFLQLTNTVLKGRAMYAQFIKEDYAVDAAIEYSLWRLNWEPGFTDDWTVGGNVTFEFTLNDVTANITITMHTTEWLSGEGLERDQQVKLTKEVTPTTALPNVPTTFTYTMTMQRLEPDDALFNPLESIKDATDAGFVYVPNSSELDGVPFDDDDLTILAEPLIIYPQGTFEWSALAIEDSMVRQDAPTQNYGTGLTMDVSSGLPSSNLTARSFLKFDISSIPLGEDIIIQSATLRLWAESYPDITRFYDLHLVTDNWTESGVNWDNQPAVAATASDSSPTPSDVNTPMEWSVLSEVLDWRDGITPNYGWRTSDDAEETGNEVYTVTVNDTLEFDILKGLVPSIIPISGDVYAIAYAGDGDDGFLKTVQIATNGQITDDVTDTLEFDTLKGLTPDIIPIDGDVYAIAYAGDGDDGFLKTVQIATDGQIADNATNILEFDPEKGKTPDIIHISGDIYAIAYAGDGDDGFLKTVKIKSTGSITNLIDTLEFDTLKGLVPSIIPISGDIYAIAYAGDGDDGFLKTVQIAANGQIADTVIDTLEFDPEKGKTPDIIHISGDIYAIAYAGQDDDGFLKTVQIATNGLITDTVIDTLEFDTLKGLAPDIIPISGDVYAIAYAGDGDDGFLKTVAITDDGNILDTVTNTPEFDPEKGKELDIIHISGDVYAIAYAGQDDDGFLKTVDLVQGDNNEHITVFQAKDNCDPPIGTGPILVVNYAILGGTEIQAIEWIFEPDLDFDYGQERTLSFKSRASLPDDTRYWNAARLLPNFSYTGMTANVTVGNPPDTGIPGAGITVTKTADPQMIYPGEPTIVTYVISITNNDIGDFTKLDYIHDYLPPGFTYVEGSATWEWPDHNSTDNPAYQIYSLYYNIGDFEPDIDLEDDGRYKLKWHKQPSANGLFPGDDELLHDRDMPAGVTYTQTFQALADEEVSGSYQNEVFVKLKDWNLYGDRDLGKLDHAYAGQTGTVIVPAFDILSETDLSTLRASAGWIADGSIVVRSWHWEERW